MKRLFFASLFLIFTCLYAYGDTEVVGGGGGVSEGTDVGFGNITATTIQVSDAVIYGDGDTQIREAADDILYLKFAGTDRWSIDNLNISSLSNFGAKLWRAGVTGTQPGFTFKADENTGVGRNTDDQLSLIAGGVEIVRITTSGTEIKGSLILPFYNMSTAYTVTATDYSIFCDASGAARTATLPTAVGIGGKIHNVKKVDSSGNACTVDGYDSETIDGSATATLASQYDSITIQSDGANWYIL